MLNSKSSQDFDELYDNNQSQFSSMKGNAM